MTYLPSSRAGELQLGVTYTLWIPEGVSLIRGGYAGTSERRSKPMPGLNVQADAGKILFMATS